MDQPSLLQQQQQQQQQPVGKPPSSTRPPNATRIVLKSKSLYKTSKTSRRPQKNSSNTQTDLNSKLKPKTMSARAFKNHSSKDSSQPSQLNLNFVSKRSNLISPLKSTNPSSNSDINPSNQINNQNSDQDPDQTQDQTPSTPRTNARATLRARKQLIRLRKTASTIESNLENNISSCNSQLEKIQPYCQKDIENIEIQFENLIKLLQERKSECIKHVEQFYSHKQDEFQKFIQNVTLSKNAIHDALKLTESLEKDSIEAMKVNAIPSESESEQLSVSLNSLLEAITNSPDDDTVSLGPESLSYDFQLNLVSVTADIPTIGMHPILKPQAFRVHWKNTLLSGNSNLVLFASIAKKAQFQVFFLDSKGRRVDNIDQIPSHLLPSATLILPTSKFGSLNSRGKSISFDVQTFQGFFDILVEGTYFVQFQLGNSYKLPKIKVQVIRLPDLNRVIFKKFAKSRFDIQQKHIPLFKQLDSLFQIESIGTKQHVYPMAWVLLALTAQRARPNPNEELVTKCLVYLYQRDDDSLVSLVNSVLTHEIQSHVIQRKSNSSEKNNRATLFRKNTLATKLVKHVSLLVGVPYLQHIIGPIIKEVVLLSQVASEDFQDDDDSNSNNSTNSTNQSTSRPDEDPLLQRPFFNRYINNSQHSEAIGELNPDGILNSTQTEYFCNRLLNRIFESYKCVPPVLRKIYQHIHSLVSLILPGSQDRAVGSFFFLRFSCAAFTMPDAYGLIENIGIMPRNLRKNLVSIAKLIQNLANEVTLSTSDAKSSQPSKPSGNLNSFKGKLTDFYANLIDIENLPEKGSFQYFPIVGPQIIENSFSELFNFLYENQIHLRTTFTRTFGTQGADLLLEISRILNSMNSTFSRKGADGSSIKIMSRSMGIV